MVATHGGVRPREIVLCGAHERTHGLWCYLDEAAAERNPWGAFATK